MTQPFVSVVVPVFNGEGVLEACLASLAAQDYPKDRYEVIVVDNNSTDATAQIVRRFPMRYVCENTRQSSYAARNRGIREARGEVIAFTDANCRATPEWLRRGVAALADASVGGVAGRIEAEAPQTIAQRYAVEKRALSQEVALTENAFRPAVYTANAFYRKSVLQQAGCFDATVKSGGDADLAWRVQERLGLPIAYASGAVIVHRHRERVWDLLRQRRNYGYGSVLNYLKHKDQMGRRTLKHAYWELRALAGKCIRFLASLGACVATLGCSRARAQRAALDGLDILVFLAKKTGQVAAAIDHKVWYF